MFDDFWCHDSWKRPSLFDKFPDIMGHHIPHHRRVLPWNQAANRCLLAVQGHVCCKLVACWWVPSSTHLTFPSSQEMRCKYEMQILYQKWKNVMLHPFQAIQTAVCAGLSVLSGCQWLPCARHATTQQEAEAERSRIQLRMGTSYSRPLKNHSPRAGVSWVIDRWHGLTIQSKRNWVTSFGPRQYEPYLHMAKWIDTILNHTKSRFLAGDS